MRTADEFSDLAIKMAPGANEQRYSETAAAWWLRGWLEYKRENYVGAERGFRGALDADRKFGNAWEGLASVMLATGQRKHAVRAIVELGNSVHEKLSKMNLHERRLEAENRRNRGLKKPIILADLFQEFGLSRHAGAQCWVAGKKRVKTLFVPQDVWVRIRLGAWLAEIPSSAKSGLEILERVRRDLEKSRTQLLTQIKRSGALSRILKDVPKIESDLAAVSAALGQVYANLGLIYLGGSDKERAHRAETEFRNAIKIAPTLGWAYSGLGDFLHTARRYAEAEETLQVGLHLALLSGKDDARTHHLLGDIYRRWAQNEKAVAHLKWAIGLAPEWAEPHRLLGYMYRLVGNLRDAAGEFKEAIRINDEDAYSHISLATCYRGLDETDLASESKNRALKLGDGKIDTQYERACFWALAGDRKRALQLLGEAISSGEVAKEEALDDVDLAVLRGEPDFETLVQEANGTITQKFRITAQGKPS